MTRRFQARLAVALVVAALAAAPVPGRAGSPRDGAFAVREHHDRGQRNTCSFWATQRFPQHGRIRFHLIRLPSGVLVAILLAPERTLGRARRVSLVVGGWKVMRLTHILDVPRLRLAVSVLVAGRRQGRRLTGVLEQVAADASSFAFVAGRVRVSLPVAGLKQAADAFAACTTARWL